MFSYFIVSFGVLLLTPFTVFKWKSERDQSEETKLEALRTTHSKSRWFAAKEQKLKTATSMPLFRRLMIILAWAFLGFIAYRASCQHEIFVPEFDPFQVFNIDRNDYEDFEASKKPIKSLYRQMSKTLHPDSRRNQWLRDNPEEEGIPEEMISEFDEEWTEIVRAYKTLTDEIAFNNWIMYGNPDGQLQTSFGIALPEWLVKEGNHLYVLGVYGLIFGIMLPAVVGNWWYKSIQYTGESVLIKTTKLFEFYVYKTPNMNRRRALMVFSGAFEFNRSHNKEIQERPSDQVELPTLISQIEEHERTIRKPPTDKPFDQSYSMKVRLMYFAHMYGIPLSTELQEDLDLVLRKMPDLHTELISKVYMLTQYMMQNGQMARVPKVESVDNMIKNMQNLVQGLPLNQRSVSFMQLPYFREEFIRHLNAKKVRSLKQLAAKPFDEIRAIFKNLTEEEFAELYTVFKSLPALRMDVDVKVEDDDCENKITAGSIVTISTKLTRQGMGDITAAADAGEEMSVNDGEMGEVKVSVNVDKEKTAQPAKKAKGKRSKGPQAMAAKRAAKEKAAKEAAEKGTGEPVEIDDDEVEEEDEKVTAEVGENNELMPHDEDAAESSEEEDDEEVEWKRLQGKVKKKESALTRDNSKITHTVYTPRFPTEKQEWWWVYLVMTSPKREKITERLMCDPVHVTNLVNEQEVDIRFQAPPRAGQYNFVVYVRSDSYIEIDCKYDFTITVHERVEQPEPEFLDSEDEADLEGGFVTDSEAEISESSSSEDESDEEEEEKKSK